MKLLIHYSEPLSDDDDEDDLPLVCKRSKLLKNPKKEEEDRLSALPDSLLLHILSLLGLKDAVRTGVLSRRWQFLWTDLSELDFRDSCDGSSETRDFVDWVGKTLVICTGIHLAKFAVTFHYEDCFAFTLNVWVQFVIRNKVKDVSFHLRSRKNESYTLPSMMYSNSSLINLSLQNCFIAPPQTVEWKSLKSLSIEQVELGRHVLGIILSGCPVLEFLKLTDCWGSSVLEINNRSLREVVIERWKDHSARSLLEIIAPCVQILSISGYYIGRQCQNFRLIGMSSLVRADLDFNEFDSLSRHGVRSSENVMDYTKELFESLRRVEELVLGTWFFEVLSALDKKGWKLPQNSCKCLTLNAFRYGQNIPGILCMLESSPKLETLVIKGSSYEVGPSHNPRDSNLEKGDLNCDLLHLKTVKIEHSAGLYFGGKAMLKLVQLLLTKATVLEKLVIDVTKTRGSLLYSSDYIKVAQTLLSYPRSSTKAVVLLS